MATNAAGFRNELRRTHVPGWSGSPARVMHLSHDMKLHPVHDGVVVDRSGVGGAPSKGLEVGLACSSKLVVADRCEGHHLDVVDFDHHRAAPVNPADLDLR